MTFRLVEVCAWDNGRGLGRGIKGDKGEQRGWGAAGEGCVAALLAGSKKSVCGFTGGFAGGNGDWSNGRSGDSREKDLGDSNFFELLKLPVLDSLTTACLNNNEVKLAS